MPVSEPKVLYLDDSIFSESVWMQTRLHSRVLGDLSEHDSIIIIIIEPSSYVLFIQNGNQPGFSVSPVNIPPNMCRGGETRESA
jgi:hypothetical protein